jgi:hypothetical protein
MVFVLNTSLNPSKPSKPSLRYFISSLIDFFTFYVFFVSRSTCAHPSLPRTHTTVASPPSGPAGIRHLTSWTLGQGHSDGLTTQSNVSGQR